ncbi:MAG: hypothetical protein ACRECY_19575, partial [Phyllobacterium sp.]
MVLLFIRVARQDRPAVHMRKPWRAHFSGGGYSCQRSFRFPGEYDRFARMHLDIIDLRAFYASVLGHLTERSITMALA